MPAIVDLTGQKFGRLTVVSFHSIDAKAKMRSSRWNCICECGKEKVTFSTWLRNGTVKTCGCRVYQRKNAGAAQIKRHDIARKCRTCGEEKQSSEFRIVRQKYLSWKCNSCYREQAARYTESREQIRVRSRASNSAARAQALAYYGGKCVCCGEAEQTVLAFDHIRGGGRRHRNEIRNTKFTTIAKWLVANKFPDGFQILCNNCNWSKHVHGAFHQYGMRGTAMLSFGA